MTRILSKILLKEELLKRLQTLHRRDLIDIEGIHYLYQRIMGKGINESEQVWPFLDGMDDETRKMYIENFLVAATAKDCSFMISLVPVPFSVLERLKLSDFSLNHLSSATVEFARCAFVYRISVTDLDRKQMENIPMYYKLDQEIVSVYSTQPIQRVCTQTILE